jgi:hypothetical protein
MVFKPIQHTPKLIRDELEIPILSPLRHDAGIGKPRIDARALQTETRACLPTPEAAYHLNRAPQTLRLWACHESGPLRPIRVNGRLMWPVAEIKQLLGLGEKQ